MNKSLLLLNLYTFFAKPCFVKTWMDKTFHISIYLDNFLKLKLKSEILPKADLI